MSLVFGLVASAAFAENHSLHPGQYILYAGGCISCHTGESGSDLAGGVPIQTPFGVIYSTNITPDPETGIGGWSLDEFSDAMRKGILPDGSHLYPAFPYTSYTQMSDDDLRQLYDYLMGIPAVRFEPPDNELKFPFNMRWLIGVWKQLFFNEGRYEPQADETDQWNRGAYLVEGLGHCGACHTSRGLLGNERSSRALSGGSYRDEIDGKHLNWFATSLRNEAHGLGAWSMGQIEEYLKLGFSERAGTFGPMNRVILNSTSHLNDHDIRAIATYLKSLPAAKPVEALKMMPPDDVMRRGEIVYDVHCGICHLPDGRGSNTTAPPLISSAVVMAEDPASFINITLYGAQLPAEPVSPQWLARRWNRMESYYDELTDREVADVLTYIRNAWGNTGAEVTVKQVNRQR